MTPSENAEAASRRPHIPATEATGGVDRTVPLRVAEVERQLSEIDALEASISRAQRRSAALRSAILERAFRGELVPQDPFDEPASALLDRNPCRAGQGQPAAARSLACAPGWMRTRPEGSLARLAVRA